MSRSKKKINQTVKSISLNDDDFFNQVGRILDSCTDIYTSDTSRISDLQTSLDNINICLMLFERFLALRTLIIDERDRIKKLQPIFFTIQLQIEARLEDLKYPASRSLDTNFTFDTSDDEVYKLYDEMGLNVRKISGNNIAIGDEDEDTEKGHKIYGSERFNSMRFPFKTSNKELYELYHSIGLECELSLE